MEIKLDEIYVPDDFNVRIRHEEASVAELMESIKSVGLLHPVTINDVVSSDMKVNGFKYKLISGFRRHLAYKNLFYDSIDAKVMHLNSLKEEMLINIIENLQRSKLTKEQEGLEYLKLKDKFGMDNSEIAVYVGKTRNYVTNACYVGSITPLKYRKLIVSDNTNITVANKSGKIFATINGKIVSAFKSRWINSSQCDKMFEYAKKDSFTNLHCTNVLSLIRQGYDIDDAFLYVEKGESMSFKVLFANNDFKRDAKKFRISKIELLHRILEEKGYKTIRNKIK